MIWKTKHLDLEASEHHKQSEPTGQREVCSINPTLSAIVLGSSQSSDLVLHDSLEADGVDFVVRRSGGGIVHLVPEHFLWIDISLPKTDPLYEEDVAKASIWVGKVWKEVLELFGIDSEVYLGPYIRGDEGGLVCFSSRASGEVIAGDIKLVGISQRRSKLGIWYQTLLMLKWQPRLLMPYIESRENAFWEKLEKQSKSLDLNREAVRTAFFEHISTY